MESSIVVIDVQERLVNAVKYSPADNVSKLVHAARLLDIPVIVTEQYPKGLGMTVDEVKSELAQNSVLVEKTAFSAFEDIKPYVKGRIYIMGIEAHICVYQTVCDLIEHGYDVYVIKDCCASRNKFEFKTGMDLMRQVGAKITCLETVLFECLKTSKHEYFKEVQGLIKSLDKNE